MIFFYLFLGERIRFCYGNNCHLCLLEYLSRDFFLLLLLCYAYLLYFCVNFA